MSALRLELIFLLTLLAVTTFCVWRVTQEPPLEVIMSDNKQPIDPRGVRNACDTEAAPVRQGMYWCFNKSMLEEALEQYRQGLIQSGETEADAKEKAAIARGFLHCGAAQDKKLVITTGGQQ